MSGTDGSIMERHYYTWGRWAKVCLMTVIYNIDGPIVIANYDNCHGLYIKMMLWPLLPSPRSLSFTPLTATLKKGICEKVNRIMIETSTPHISLSLC